MILTHIALHQSTFSVKRLKAFHVNCRDILILMDVAVTTDKAAEAEIIYLCGLSITGLVGNSDEILISRPGINI